MQAIITKYYGAGNVRGARVVAKSASGLKLSMSYDHVLSADENHKCAAVALCAKYGWTNELLGGGLSNSEEVWVMIPRGYRLVADNPAFGKLETE